MQVRRGRTFAALISLATAATITLTNAPGAQADVQAPTHGKLIGSFTPQDLASHPVPHLTSLMKASAERCAPLPAGSTARNAGATTACIQVSGSSGSSPAQSSRLGTAQEAAATCSVTSPGSYYYHRHDYCLNSLKVTYTEFNEQNPAEILGTGVLTVSSSAALSASSGQWQESQTVTLAEATGLVKELSVGLTASCNGSCTATVPTAWAGSRLLTLGQSASGSVTYLATPGAGLQSNITTSYDLNVTQPGAVPIVKDVTWSNPRQVRCDTTFANNTSTGCIIPSIRAQLILPLSTYGAAAATYAWAENNLIDHWGADDSPLQRLANENTQTANRTNTCGTGASRSFTPLPATVPDDSCDEYPFAGSYQGGSNGALCADIIPLLQNGVWNFYQDPNAPAVTFNEPCVRGHVPSTQNSAAGGKLGSNNQTERVLDLEKFDVVVTA
ncbi:hypothetical protein GCM10010345_90800 [Streptomyces canarius]|uniref:Deoxyribonuclease NucA/NucB domain-containing protein n=2 Tax=Streptomyces TaxID=1883 RepID=A0ABQ3DBH2_9ACTN|nr:hypothetical protein GCM10010345_90800 [Streptomyces canarius]